MKNKHVRYPMSSSDIVKRYPSVWKDCCIIHSDLDPRRMLLISSFVRETFLDYEKENCKNGGTLYQIVADMPPKLKIHSRLSYQFFENVYPTPTFFKQWSIADTFISNKIFIQHYYLNVYARILPWLKAQWMNYLSRGARKRS